MRLLIGNQISAFAIFPHSPIPRVCNRSLKHCPIVPFEIQVHPLCALMPHIPIANLTCFVYLRPAQGHL